MHNSIADQHLLLDQWRASNSMSSGYWGEHTATRDWCEPNYSHSQYIAEFWNTFSNLLYILISFNLLRHKWRLSALPEFQQYKSLNITIAGLFTLGVTSGSFHATLKYWPQILDRVSCIWPLIGIEIGFNEFEKDIGFSILSLCSYIAASAVAFFLIFELWCFWMAVHSMYRGYLIVIQNDLEEVVFHGQKTIAMVVAAVIVWGLDILTCEFFLSYNFLPHFHAIWHVLTALAFQETALIQIFLFLRKLKQRPRFVSYNMLNIRVDCEMKPISI